MIQFILFLIVERVVKDSLLSQNSTSSTVAPPPPPPVVARSPPSRPPIPPSRNEKPATKTSAAPVQNTNDNMDSSSCSSPSSSDNDDPKSDIENEEPQLQAIPSTNKRARADATSTESLSPPRASVTNSNRMILRSNSRRQSDQPVPASTPSFRQLRKHRRIELEVTPLSGTNKKKQPPKQSSTPHLNK